MRLGGLYGQMGKNDEALARFNKGAELAPRDPGMITLVGMLNERKGDAAKARDAYEKALAINPRFAVAANNLAVLLSNQEAEKDRALQLAQTARAVAPDEPHIADTLGWMLYRRGVYQRALSLVQEAGTKLRDSPEIQYHLGMAYLKTGDKENARKALASATAVTASFSGKEEAKKALSELR